MIAICVGPTLTAQRVMKNHSSRSPENPDYAQRDALVQMRLPLRGTVVTIDAFVKESKRAEIRFGWPTFEDWLR